jgi:hypothetical protein
MKNTLVLLLVGNKAPTPELVQEMAQDQEARYLIIQDQNGPIGDQILHWLAITKAPCVVRILPYHPDHKGWNQTNLTDLKRRLFPESTPSSMIA